MNFDLPQRTATGLYGLEIVSLDVAPLPNHHHGAVRQVAHDSPYALLIREAGIVHRRQAGSISIPTSALRLVLVRDIQDVEPHRLRTRAQKKKYREKIVAQHQELDTQKSDPLALVQHCHAKIIVQTRPTTSATVFRTFSVLFSRA